ncbi:MAG: hypothetical protein UT39_C0005G0046 [Candidatus Woesebacteria bacterium GW2011_GWA1_39_21]|uniref:Uncharacterized protein n=1 Tax=Candidatus Woesebacteria bacterium GW2011_GWA1_39_21 TaxID=1618550 RepID=A0A0G0NFP2_9BACT|nr:MAG: hypothetical protein UT39_C0005G0046 [Candidatus Woesebacteria bacterium GW2011_GWA1_39_21]
MQIKILGNRKLLMILPLVIVFLLVVGLITYRPSVTGNISDNNLVSLKPQADGENDAIFSANLETEDFLYEKSVSLIIQISKADNSYLENPVYQGVKESLLNRVSGEISPLGSDIKIRVLKVFVNSDKLSGTVYLGLDGGPQKIARVTISYYKNSQGEWKLSDFHLGRPVSGG